jgi:hypothetical protein
VPTPLPEPTFQFPGQDKISMNITSKFMARTTHYKIQFVAPCLVRYYMPNVRPPSRLCGVGLVTSRHPMRSGGEASSLDGFSQARTGFWQHALHMQ